MEAPRIVLLIFVSGKIVVTGWLGAGASQSRLPDVFRLTVRVSRHSYHRFCLLHCRDACAGAKGRSAIVEGVGKLYPMMFKFRKAPSAPAGSGAGY